MIYNTAGLSTGVINSETWNSLASLGINSIVNRYMPSINVPIGNFGISISPAFGFGEGGLNSGLNASLWCSSGDWTVSTSCGVGSTYYGWSTSVGYDDFSIGYGATTYRETKIEENIIERQTVGTFSMSWRNLSLTVSNDLFGDKEDRGRTSAVELGIGDFLIGTSVLTNWGKKESGMARNPINDEKVGPHIFDKKEGRTYGSWTNGEVFHSPFWIGGRSGNHVFRVGGSARIVQKQTQNRVHKYMHTPYFTRYNNFKRGPFSYYGYYNPLTLWNN